MSLWLESGPATEFAKKRWLKQKFSRIMKRISSGWYGNSARTHLFTKLGDDNCWFCFSFVVTKTWAWHLRRVPNCTLWGWFPSLYCLTITKSSFSPVGPSLCYFPFVMADGHAIEWNSYGDWLFTSDLNFLSTMSSLIRLLNWTLGK